MGKTRPTSSLMVAILSICFVSSVCPWVQAFFLDLGQDSLAFSHSNQSLARQLRTKLCNMKKRDHFVTDFLLRFQTIVHSFQSVGDPVFDTEQLDILSKGLPAEYESFISLLNSKPELISFVKIESLLVA